jgi:phytanoyl-CoA hydroxylase
MINLLEINKKFNKDGFCILDSFFTDDEVKELDKKVSEFINLKSNTLKGKDINKAPDKSINTMHDIDKHEQYFANFAKKSKIVSIAKLLLNSEPDFRKCEMFAKPPKVGMPSPFHQDNFLWAVKNNNGITFWVALDFCNYENAGLTYIEGSHKLGLLTHEDSYAPGTSQKLTKEKLDELKKNFKVVTPTLKPGDVMVHHCLTVHGSSENKSDKSRRGFTIQFKDKFSEYDNELKNYYESSLKKQLLMRNQ